MECGQGGELGEVELFGACGGIDVRGKGMFSAEDGADLLTAFGEEGLTESGQGGQIGGKGLVASFKGDAGGVDFGLWPEALGRELGDAADVERRLEEDGQGAEVFFPVGGEESVGDLGLQHDHPAAAFGVIHREVDQER